MERTFNFGTSSPEAVIVGDKASVATTSASRIGNQQCLPLGVRAVVVDHHFKAGKVRELGPRQSWLVGE